jgi:uncharacterized membrane protein YbaN (DUF454 family)
MGLGIAGIVLPLVPTTPFLLLAAFAFARSSPRLHDWLLAHPRLGPPINDWRTHRAISRRAKGLAVGAMAAALGLSIATGLPVWLVAVQAVVLALVAAFILTRPDGPRQRVEKPPPSLTPQQNDDR